MDARERLTAERTDIVARLRRLDASFADIVDAARDSNWDDEHDTEGGTIAAERSMVGSFAATSRQHLNEIDRALARLDDGSYGICVACARPIAEGRLEARPTATTCVACAASHHP